MVSLTALWLPILIAAVIVFIASSIIHMVMTYHRSDFDPLPGESKITEAMRAEGVSPGDYVFPHAPSLAATGTPEMLAKYKQGPVGVVTVQPNGSPNLPKMLIQWFIYIIVVGVLVAYVTGRTVGAGSEYMTIFRVSGAVAFICYAGAEPINSIWYGRKWSTTAKNMFDSLIFALLTAGSFAGFYPG